MVTGLKHGFSLVVLASLVNLASAAESELFADPTRPAFESVGPAEGGLSGASPTAPVVINDNLQSVIISPKYRAAVINGVTVALGEKIGDSTLVEVNDSNVVLTGGKSRRVLELFPGVRINKIALPVAQEELPSEVKKIKKTNKKKVKKASTQNSLGQNKDERNKK